MDGPDILVRIIENTRKGLSALRQLAEAENWEYQARTTQRPLSFLEALRGNGAIRAIAEIKRASPSAGVLRSDFDAAAIARSYACNGAACVSVLTDDEFFQGSLADLQAVRLASPLPILRKDFVLDRVQIDEAKIAGASAVLLIAECLEAATLHSLVRYTRDLDMTPLVEVHDGANLAAALSSESELIGINNRDLHTFRTDLARTMELMQHIPRDRIVVSESGIRSRGDVLRLERAGVHAILVGETLMRATKPGDKLAELLGKEPVL